MREPPVSRLQRAVLGLEPRAPDRIVRRPTPLRVLGVMALIPALFVGGYQLLPEHLPSYALWALLAAFVVALGAFVGVLPALTVTIFWRAAGRHSWAIDRSGFLYVPPDGVPLELPLAAMKECTLEKGIPVVRASVTLSDGRRGDLELKLGAWGGNPVMSWLEAPSSARALVDAIEKARQGIGAAFRDVTPAGATVIELDQAIRDPMWAACFFGGRVLERVRIGPYLIFVLDTEEVPASVIAYRYRALALSRTTGQVVLAYNLERSAGGCFLGLHSSEGHANLGPADPAMSADEFQRRAVETLAAELTRLG